MQLLLELIHAEWHAGGFSPSLIQNWTGGGMVQNRRGISGCQMLLYDLGQATGISLTFHLEKDMGRFICDSSPRLLTDIYFLCVCVFSLDFAQPMVSCPCWCNVKGESILLIRDTCVCVCKSNNLLFNGWVWADHWNAWEESVFTALWNRHCSVTFWNTCKNREAFELLLHTNLSRCMKYCQCTVFNRCGHAVTVVTLLTNLLVFKESTEEQWHLDQWVNGNVKPQLLSILPANKAIRHKHLPEHHLNDLTINWRAISDAGELRFTPLPPPQKVRWVIHHLAHLHTYHQHQMQPLCA